jgi:hypothetical protein
VQAPEEILANGLQVGGGHFTRLRQGTPVNHKRRPRIVYVAGWRVRHQARRVHAGQRGDAFQRLLVERSDTGILRVALLWQRDAADQHSAGVQAFVNVGEMQKSL